MKDFFRKNGLLVLLIAVLLAAVTAVFSYAFQGLPTPLSNVLGVVTTPVRSGISSLAHWVEGVYNYSFRYDELQAENEALREEIQELREQLIDYETARMENEQFRELLEIKERNSDFLFEPATVVARSPDDRFGSFTIDAGSYEGVTLRCPVITSDGLVGIVSEVGYSYSKVQTILDTAVNIGGVDIHTLDSGIVTGSIPLALEGHCQLGYLPRESGVTPGDTVVTSGTGGLLPKGLVIGEVLSVETDASGLSLTAVVEPAADIQGARQVFVITDFSGKDEAAQETQDETPGEEE